MPQISEATNSEIIQATRIDTPVESLGPKPNLTGVNVEGWEGKAVRGLAHTVTTLRLYLILALYYPRFKEPGDNADGILRMLVDYQYRLERFSSREEDRKLGEETAGIPLGGAEPCASKLLAV